MQVRVFESTDMASGLKKIKEELGPDALILSTRTVRNGKLGLLGKPILEITAAVDANLPKTRKGGDKSPGFTEQATYYPPAAREQKIGFRHVVDDSVAGYLHQPAARRSDVHHPERPVAPKYLRQPAAERSDVHHSKRPLAPKGVHPVPLQAGDPLLQEEVKELKELVKGLAAQITTLAAQGATEAHGRQTALQLKTDAAAGRHTGTALQSDHLLTMLIDRGINVETSRTIAGFLRQSLTEQELTDAAQVTRTIISSIQEIIEVRPPVFAAGQKQQRIALVGPTGVGKTTTLAKIAANYLSRYSNSIALITIDTYRIAAVEQLKVYGEIMHLPVEVVITPEQLEQAITRHSDKELILIDTAGRSPRDSYCIDELTTFLPAELDIAKHLVLAAGSRENELLSTIECFNTLGITNTIFTKIDECTTLGILLNVQLQNSNPLSYVTNGQRVPEDLMEITPEIVAQLIMSQNEGSLHD